jgi:hypothetical protein
MRGSLDRGSCIRDLVVVVDEGPWSCECMELDIGHIHVQENGIGPFVWIMQGERTFARSGERFKVLASDSETYPRRSDPS